MFTGVVPNAPAVVGCEVAPKADVGGGPKEESVIAPGCDPPDPSVDGCPKDGACCVLPNADGVGFGGWPNAGVVVEVCVVPKTDAVLSWGVPKVEAVVFWGVPNTEVGGFVELLLNTEVVGLANAPNTD